MKTELIFTAKECPENLSPGTWQKLCTLELKKVAAAVDLMNDDLQEGITGYYLDFVSDIFVGKNIYLTASLPKHEGLRTGI